MGGGDTCVTDTVGGACIGLAEVEMGVCPGEEPGAGMGMLPVMTGPVMTGPVMTGPPGLLMESWEPSDECEWVELSEAEELCKLVFLRVLMWEEEEEEEEVEEEGMIQFYKKVGVVRGVVGVWWYLPQQTPLW